MARNGKHTDHIHRVIGDYATAIRRSCAIKLYQTLAILIICSPAFAAEHARRVTVDTSSFSSNLSTTDDTVQKALDTLDDMVAGASGVNWDDIGGTQSDINVSGFTNDSGYISDINWSDFPNEQGYITGTNWADMPLIQNTGINWDGVDQNVLNAIPWDDLGGSETNWDNMPLITTSGVNWDDLNLEQADGYNNTDWNTAYGWGNHAEAGYLTEVTAAADKILEGNTEAEVVDTGSNGHFKVTTEGVERLRVDASGKLGIGTSAPAQALDIVGNITLQATTDSTSGVILKGSSRFLHNYGTNNVFLGLSAGNYTMSGSTNNGIGYEALQSLTSGNQNNVMGYRAGKAITSGVRNVYIGDQAGTASSSGNGNIALGFRALSNYTSGSGGFGGNIAIGEDALIYLQTGYENVAVGRLAGKNIASGANNSGAGFRSVFVGHDSRPSDAGETNQIVIGALSRGLGSNTAIIGNSSITKTQLQGDIGIGTSAPAARIHALGTIEQLRLDYDGSNYLSVTVNDEGSTTLKATGTAAKIVLDNDVEITGDITLEGDTVIFDADLAVIGNLEIQNNSNTCVLIVDADATCDAGTKIGENNSIALCLSCS